MKVFFLTIVVFLSAVVSATGQSSNGSEFLKYFQGTFASTPKGDLWVKITVKDKEVTIWQTIGQTGKWGNPTTCTINESSCVVCTDRNSDGSKYYSIRTKGCKGAKLPVEISFNYCPSCTRGTYTYQMGEGGAVLAKVGEDYNPWD